MAKIKNIIFDLGGIFLNIDFSKARKAFIDLGVSDFDNLYSQHNANNLFQLLETGNITPKEFHDSFVEQTGVPLTYTQLTDAWNALLLDFPSERLKWLKDIGKKYNTFLFSNTNQIHYEAFSNSFRQQTGEDFDSYFKKTYYSHQMGLRKPDPESYLYILKEQQLHPSETLFVDDTLKNIEGANRAGLQTAHIVPPMSVMDIIIE
jgi:putative hydrolase of the HAD superfamily